MSEEAYEPCCGLDAATSTMLDGLATVLRYGYYDAVTAMNLAESVIEANRTSCIQPFTMQPYDHPPNAFGVAPNPSHKP